MVRDESQLRDALARARRLAAGAFGDERLLLERLVDGARHIEVQVVADEHGTVITAGERDCSTQRRHQKILEETPAPSLDERRRKGLANAATALALGAGYRGAGTAEFVVDENGDFYFLEVNARLQVEHPVTELVWGIDLVEQQLRVALGERLPVDANPRGHAIEVRVYAEDPSSGFLPSTGRLAHLRWPEEVRVDAGYDEADLVTRHYDPLLAKIVARGEDRSAALALLARSLDATEILGLRTNLAFLRALVAHPSMRAGRVDTGFVERELAELTPPATSAPDQAYAVAAASVVASTRDRSDPWTATGPWRVGGIPTTAVLLREGDRERAVRLDGVGPYRHAGHRVEPGDERHRWLVDGEAASAAAASTTVWTSWRGGTWELETAPRDRGVERIAGAEVAAPMPGVVIAASAQAGRRVRRGELLFVVEAMKMELRVEAPADGSVTRVLARVGQQVKRGQRLADFDAEKA
jgi:3-methylcrotonyl-CoA carboxylase alpha subunit